MERNENAERWCKRIKNIPGLIASLPPLFSPLPSCCFKSGRKEKHHIQLNVFFQHYWTNRPTVGTLGPVHKVLLITSWQWESLQSRWVWDQADLIMIIGRHQLQITLMERDFSDQEHIFDCRSKFAFSLFFNGTSYYATLWLCSQ